MLDIETLNSPTTSPFFNLEGKTGKENARRRGGANPTGNLLSVSHISFCLTLIFTLFVPSTKVVIFIPWEMIMAWKGVVGVMVV